MKILFYSHFFKPETGAGSVRAQYLVNVMRNSGYQVDVISPHPNYPQKAKYAKPPKLIYHVSDLNVTYLPIYIPFRDSLVKRFLSYMSYTTFSFFYVLFTFKKYDIVVASSPPIFTSFAAYLASWFKRTKFIWDIRDFWPEIGVELGILKDPFMIKSLAKLESIMLNNSDGILVTSEGSKKHLLGKGLNHSNIGVAYNGADSEVFKPACFERKLEIRQKYGLDNSKLILTYFGSFNSGMNDILLLADALSSLESIKDKFQVVLIGDGYNKTEFINKIRNKVDFVDMGSQGNKITAEIVSGCDLSLIPRKSLNNDTGGNIPVKCFESWACGIPVLLASDSQTEIASIFSECQAGFKVNSNSVEELKNKIREIILGEFDLKKMGELGRNFVENKYDRNIQAKSLINVIQKINTK